jgi:hypothetical protein
MVPSQFHLVAQVSSDSPAEIEPLLRKLAGCKVSETDGGFNVDGWVAGADPRELNRELLTSLRRVERRTRLRAEWTADGVAHRFFDYVPKGTHPAALDQPGAARPNV